jgi:hypothetical protein
MPDSRAPAEAGPGDTGKVCMNRLARPIEIKTLFAFVLASLLVSSLAQRYLGHVMPSPDLDFYDYYFAAQVVHDNPHADIYAGATEGNPQLRSAPAGSELFAHARAAGFDDIELYLYPPILADLLAPFSQLPPHFAAVLWRAFSLAMVLVSVLLLARMLRLPILSFEFAVLALAAYSFWPIHEAVSLGQIAIIMLALWTIGVVAYCDDHMILSAAAFAFATAFKVTPILLLPLFFLWRDRRWLISYFAILLGLVAAMAAVNGPQTLSIYATVMSAMGGGIPAFQNKSLSALAAWAYYGKLFTLNSARSAMADPPRALLIAAKAVSGAFYLLSLFLVWRSRRQLDRTSRASTIAVFGLVTACVSPVSWRHGYAVALIALAIFWAKALRNPPRVLHAVLLALTTFTIGSLFFDLAAQAPLPQFCKILFAALWIVFSVLFCLDVLYHADAGGRADAGVVDERVQRTGHYRLGYPA